MPFARTSLLVLFGLLVFLNGGFASAGTYASSRPASALQGIVWTPPSAPEPAVRALQRIDAVGANAVRLTRTPPDTVFAQADTLGLALYVDLPVTSLPATVLDDSLATTAAALDRLLAQAESHSSLTAIGLARSVDTTVPAACDALARWTARIQRSAPSLSTYYVTPFSAAADRCADAVDTVLLDVRGRSAPWIQLEKWRAKAPNVEVGAVGTWARPGASAGLRVPHSPERQARLLERALGRWHPKSGAAMPDVFVYRWRDADAPVLPPRRYGLHTEDGTPRPAARVVEGFYSGAQRVFAFQAGSPPSTDPHGLILFGWGLVGLLGLIVAWRPFVRDTLTRYFGAHGFYRDAVEEGRDLEPGTVGTLLALVAAALGVGSARLAQAAASAPATGHVLAAVPSGLRSVLAGGTVRPLLTGVFVGGGMLWLLFLWTLTLVFAARREGQFSLGQGLTLVTYPCWPALFFLPLTLIATTRPPFVEQAVWGLLIGGSALSIAYFMARVLQDYQAVTGLPWAVAGPLAIFSPPVLLLGIGTGLAVQYDVPIRFLWYLATRT